jgi:hypothetical protein
MPAVIDTRGIVGSVMTLRAQRAGLPPLAWWDTPWRAFIDARRWS